MGKRAADQGWPFPLVHAYAANTHQVSQPKTSFSLKAFDTIVFLLVQDKAGPTEVLFEPSE